MKRKLASIQQIAEAAPIPNSDNLSHYRINGWWVVDRKDMYNVGDLVIYLEVDSWVPSELASFLSKGKEPREFNGVKGERLRTIKLRGALSQGLILNPISIFTKVDSSGRPKYVTNAHRYDFPVGTDLTGILEIQKYEKPLPAQLAGMAKSNFPSFLRKTDQERVQNIDLSQLLGQQFEVTEKLDGSSMTIYYNEGEWGVCSRNIDLKLDQEGNAFVDMFHKLKPSIEAGMNGTNFAIQGELIGGKIQGNPYKLNDFEFYVFSVFSIDDQEYFPPYSAKSTAQAFGLKYVPILDTITLTNTDGTKLLSNADGTSVLADTPREGLVYKSTTTQSSFKVISNKWLLSNE